MVTRVTKSSKLNRMNDKKTPASLSERVRASEARKIEAGGRRLPGGMLPADASTALDSLQTRGFASSAAGCIARALVEASERLDESDRLIRGKGKGRG